MITEIQPGNFVVGYTCAICGRPGDAEAARDCPPEMLTRFLNLLTCNPCIASLDDRRWLEKRIGGFLKPLILGAALDCQDMAAINDAVMAEVTRYCNFICRLHGTVQAVDTFLAPMLLENPERWKEILRAYETGIRTMPPPQPELSVFQP